MKIVIKKSSHHETGFEFRNPKQKGMQPVLKIYHREKGYLAGPPSTVEFFGVDEISNWSLIDKLRTACKVIL